MHLKNAATIKADKVMKRNNNANSMEDISRKQAFLFHTYRN